MYRGTEEELLRTLERRVTRMDSRYRKEIGIRGVDMMRLPEIAAELRDGTSDVVDFMAAISSTPFPLNVLVTGSYSELPCELVHSGGAADIDLMMFRRGAGAFPVGAVVDRCTSRDELASSPTLAVTTQPPASAAAGAVTPGLSHVLAKVGMHFIMQMDRSGQTDAVI